MEKLNEDQIVVVSAALTEAGIVPAALKDSEFLEMVTSSLFADGKGRIRIVDPQYDGLPKLSQQDGNFEPMQLSEFVESIRTNPRHRGRFEFIPDVAVLPDVDGIAHEDFQKMSPTTRLSIGHKVQGPRPISQPPRQATAEEFQAMQGLSGLKRLQYARARNIA